MITGRKAAQVIRAQFRNVCSWLGGLFAIFGPLGLRPARANTGRRTGPVAVLALSAALGLLSPLVARAADGDGCNYLEGNPGSYNNGAYVITSGPVTRAAPPGNQTGIVNYASGTVLYYSYTVSDPSITARLTYAGLSGLGIDIVPATSTGGSGSFTLPVDSRVVTPSATIPGAGPGGTVTWTVYCGVRASQAVASTTGTVGTAMDFTPVTASFGRGTHTFALSGGTLPTGLSFNTGTGAITGTPTATLAATTFTVDVTHQGTGSASQTFELIVSQAAPTVSAVSPSSGPAAGGTSVTITGTGFLLADPTGAVKFGANTATYTINSDTQIAATAPAGASGLVDVTVTTTGGTSAISAADRYTYVAAPTVSAVTPDAGPIAGGSAVVLTGTGFTGATAVTFGATLADDLVVVSPTQITATSPAGTGTINVRVTTNGGTSATGTGNQFTYVAAPQIDTISPASGPTAGGTAVTLTGTNLTNATLTVDGAPITPTDNAATAITFTTPAHAAGAVSVVATTAGGSTSASFTYVTAPVASSFTASAVAYGASGVTFSLAGHASNSPAGYAVGSATTANGGSVSVNSAGLVTYTAPTRFRGNDFFTFTATNLGGTSSPATVTVPVSNPTLSSTLVGSGTRGVALSGVAIDTSGGAAPYSCSTTPASGALPAGTALNSDCTISGTPEASGSFNFTAHVTDASIGTGPFTQTTGTLTLNIAAPTISLSPAAGALPAGAVGVNYSQSFTAGGGTSGHTYAHTDGDLPPGLALTGDTVSGTPTTKGSFAFDITATDSSTVGSGGPYATTQSYSIEVDLGTQTISFGSLSNISLSSSPPALVATASSGLTVSFASTTSTVCTVSGTTVTLLDLGLCSITASQAGDDDWGAATDVVQSFTVTPGTLVLTAEAATGLKVGVSYSQANTVSGGLAPYTYALNAGALLPDTSLDTATGTVSGTPTVAGSFSYIIQVTDGQTPPVTAVTPVTTVNIAKGDQTLSFTSTAPAAAIAGGTPYVVSATSSASSLGVSYSLDGSSTGCELAGNTVSFTGVGTCVVNASQEGDANWNAATDIQQSFSVGQATPTLTVSSNNGEPVTGTTITLTATLSGSASPSGTITFKDGPTTLGTGTISGTTATFSTAALAIGPHSITAEYVGDTNNAAATSASTTVTVVKAAPAVSVSADNDAPIHGTTVTFTATLSGGLSPSGTVTFKDGSTTLGTGSVSGTTATFSTAALALGPHSITADYAGDASNEAASSSAYSITVEQEVIFTFTPAPGALNDAMAGEDYTQPISAAGGTGTMTYELASGALPEGMTLLPSGELTGPLDAAAEVKGYSFTVEARDSNGATGTASYTLDVLERAVTVIDKDVDVPAGTAPFNVNLEDGATGGPFTAADLTFVEPPNAGTASIILGEFAALDPMPLSWYLKFVPNPAYSGTVKVGFKLTSALGVSNTGTVTYTLAYDAPEVAEEIDGLVHDFIGTRQSLISSTIKVPGLVERRRMETATDPVSAYVNPSETGLSGSFATSLMQLVTGQNDAVSGDYAAPFNIWVDGTLTLHNREQNDGRWGSFAMLNFGADYLLSDTALVGLSFHLDSITDPTDEDSELTGNGWLAGPYASFEIGEGVFWDTSLLYGGSSNEIDTAFWDGSFDTQRWMLDTSITGQLQLDEVTVFTPKLRAVYFSETVDDYAVENADGDLIELEGFEEEQFRVSLGAEIARAFTLEGDMLLTPRLGVTGGLSSLDGSGAFGSLSAGLSLQTQDAWTFEGGLLIDFEGDGQKSLGAKAGISGGF